MGHAIRTTRPRPRAFRPKSPPAIPSFTIDEALEGDWLLLRLSSATAVPAVSADRLTDALVFSGSLPGSVKLTLDASGQLTPQAELLVDKGADLARIRILVNRTYAGLAAAAKWLDDGRLPGLSTGPAEAPTDKWTDRWRSLIAETNWPHTVHADGRIAVELEVARTTLIATLEPAGGGTRLVVRFEATPETGTVQHRAQSIVLLRAAAKARMVRAVAERRDEQIVFALESRLNARSRPLELATALSALSVACRHVAAEMALMNDELIAKMFLSLRGWSSGEPVCS